MISLWPWTRSKNDEKKDSPRQVNAAAPTGSTPGGNASAPLNNSQTKETLRIPKPNAALKIRNQMMPRPAIRWVGEGRIALRGFYFEADVDAICAFQEETYKLNFPDFRYTPAFAEAFRYDLRRASLDTGHGLFVLDDGRETPAKKSGNIAGFLWVVVAQNTWSGERYGYVNNVYVVAERRGLGLARELMKQADEFFRSRGIKRVRLTVTADNQSAVSLYGACGYETDRWEMTKEL